jgi:iron complex outermembrane receptor protein
MNLSRGFRAPNISELASNGVHEGTERYEVGTQTLGAETSWQSDLGVDYYTDRMKVQLSLFANRIGGYIFSEKTPEWTVVDDHDVYRFTSGDALLWGGEVSADWHVVEALHFENTFCYVGTRQLHQPADARHLPLTPAPRITSNLRYDWLRLKGRLRDAFAQVGVEGTFRQDDFYAANGTETATPGYALLNAGVGFSLHNSRRKVASIYVVGSNLSTRPLPEPPQPTQVHGRQRRQRTHRRLQHGPQREREAGGAAALTRACRPRRCVLDRPAAAHQNQRPLHTKQEAHSLPQGEGMCASV